MDRIHFYLKLRKKYELMFPSATGVLKAVTDRDLTNISPL